MNISVALSLSHYLLSPKFLDFITCLTAPLVSRGPNELWSLISHANCPTLTYETKPDGASL